MSVGHDELHAAQAASGQLSQELGPDRLGFRGADLHAENLTPAIGVDADGDDHGNRDDAAAAADLEVGRVDPEKGFYLAVDLFTQPRHLALGDAGHAHRLDQVVDRARRDALDIGLLNDSRQGLLGHAPWLQKAGKVAAPAQLRNAQLDCAGSRLPIPVAVAIALGEALGTLLAIAGAGRGTDLQFHQPLGGKADHLAQQIGIRGLLQKAAQAHHVVGHQGISGPGWMSQPSLTGNRW